jgi:predicted transcriptional regulator YheO
MKSFKQMSEGGGVIKSLAFFLRNKLGSNVKSGLSSTNVSEKLDATLSAIGILGSIGIMNIGMEDKGKSLLSRGVIIRGLINELYEEGIINQKEKELFND